MKRKGGVARQRLKEALEQTRQPMNGAFDLTEDMDSYSGEKAEKGTMAEVWVQFACSDF